MSTHELILGGQRSGKSREAERRALHWLQAAPGREAALVATARAADGEMLRYYKSKFPSRKWKTGMIKTVKGTLDHTVRGKLKDMNTDDLDAAARTLAGSARSMGLKVVE